MGSFETLGILKEARVAMPAVRGKVAGALIAALLRQRLSGAMLPRRLLAMAGTGGIVVEWRCRNNNSNHKRE